MEGLQAQLWKTELEIMDVFHSVCVENNLKYSLAYGTLLGAVRHKGFIPWDDDIDVLMPREDYEKFISLFLAAKREDYLLLSYSTTPDYTNTFIKIVKNHTTFLQYERDRNRKFHKGIFVDIFPMDRVAPGRIGKRFQKLFCLLALLYNRGYTSGDRGVRGLIEKALLAVVPQRNYHSIERWAEKKATRWNNNKSLEWFGFQTVADMEHHYSPDSFDNLVELEFEKKRYLAFRQYDDVLRDEFGDYMQLPPEHERVWKHHPILIDFEHDYEELE